MFGLPPPTNVPARRRIALGLTGVAAATLAGCGGSSAKPNASTSPYGPASSPAALSRCMRANGVSGFPDPTAAPGGGVGLTLFVNGDGSLTAEGSTFAGPAVRSAERACTASTARRRPASGSPRGATAPGADARALHAGTRGPEFPGPDGLRPCSGRSSGPHRPAIARVPGCRPPLWRRGQRLGRDWRLSTHERASDVGQTERCFVAYAAHELRGEIALQLALAEAVLTDPDADTAALRGMGMGVVAACERQRRLLEALLTLARSEYGHLRREPVDLAATAAEVLQAHGRHADRRTTALEPARTTGDRLLIERLVANLVQNAVRHNVPEGWFDVATYTAGAHAIFTITNTGPVIPTGELTRLFQPFQRRSGCERSCTDGVGLGLAIVQAIANAHDAVVSAKARAGGGLRIEIGFPVAALSRRAGGN